jgi:hypothetical protein
MAKITYSTRTLAEAMIPDAADNIKSATRTLRKFLRDELGEGRAVVGKGGRYALEYGAPELRALKKKFAAWEIAQEEAKIARAEALAAAKAPKTPEAVIEDDEVETDNDDTAPEGPTDEEITAMLSDDDEADTED